MNIFFSALYRIMEWISRFAYIQILWLLFTLLGLGLLGFFPATISMLAVMRDWFLGKPDSPIFRTFWSYYKKEFIRANLFGMIIVLFISTVAINLFFIRMNEHVFSINVVLSAISLFIIVYILYLLPAYTHFDLKFWPLFKNAFLILLVSPFETLAIIVSLIALSIIIKFIPAIGFIFGISLSAFISLWGALHAFNKVLKSKRNT